jgi:prepilin-type N-terminal cleavage/methylation domain-containing protein
MKKNIASNSAFTLVEIMIVVAIIGLLASIAIPSFIKARDDAQRVACISNLKQIAGAKQGWALENRRQGTDTPGADDLFGAGKRLDEKPACPANGSYRIGAVDEKPECSVPSHKY